MSTKIIANNHIENFINQLGSLIIPLWRWYENADDPLEKGKIHHWWADVPRSFLIQFETILALKQIFTTQSISLMKQEIVEYIEPYQQQFLPKKDYIFLSLILVV